MEIQYVKSTKKNMGGRSGKHQILFFVPQATAQCLTDLHQFSEIQILVLLIKNSGSNKIHERKPKKFIWPYSWNNEFPYK